MNLKKLVCKLVEKYPKFAPCAGAGLYGIFFLAKKIMGIKEEGFSVFFTKKELERITDYSYDHLCFKVDGYISKYNDVTYHLKDLRQKGFSF